MGYENPIKTGYFLAGFLVAINGKNHRKKSHQVVEVSPRSPHFTHRCCHIKDRGAEALVPTNVASNRPPVWRWFQPEIWRFEKQLREKWLKSHYLHTIYISGGWPWDFMVWLLEKKTNLFGGWTSPVEIYDRQNGFIFPKVRSENKKYLSCHHLVMIHAKLEEDRKCCKFSRRPSDGAEVYFTDKTEKLLGKSPAPLRDWDYWNWILGVFFDRGCSNCEWSLGEA